MEPHELSPLIEALLFAAPEPLTIRALVKAVGDESVDRTAVKNVLDALSENYAQTARGFELVRLGQGYQILTRPDYAEFVENLLRTRRRARLSRAALETAAVIAYKQPISRMEVERIRGVDCGGVLSTLIERGLVMIKGRDPGPGRPLLYGTTQAFLEYFGLSKITDLPQLDELAALAGVDRESWDKSEQARFEKHGVDLDSVPTPPSLTHAEPEAEFELDEMESGENELDEPHGSAGVEGEFAARELEEPGEPGVVSNDIEPLEPSEETPPAPLT